MASSSSGDKHFNLRLSTKHFSVSFTQHLTVLFLSFHLSHLVVWWLTDRLQKAGTLASGSTHLLPFLPQPADPQQVPERRCWKNTSDCYWWSLMPDNLFRWASFIFSCVFLVPQDTVCRPPAVDTAVLQTAPTCTCLEATTQTLRRQAGPTTKTTLFSGSSGGSILRQPPGSKSAQRVTCPQSWPPCQVRTHSCLV